MKIRNLFRFPASPAARGEKPPRPRSILFMAPLEPANRVDLFIQALELLHEQGVECTATIIGDPTESASAYAHDIRNAAAALALEGFITMRAAATKQAEAELFRSHAIYCNLASSGSSESSILQAIASGCVCVVANDVFTGVLPSGLVIRDLSAETVSDSLRRAIELQGIERDAILKKSRAYLLSRKSSSHSDV